MNKYYIEINSICFVGTLQEVAYVVANELFDEIRKLGSTCDSSLTEDIRNLADDILILKEECYVNDVAFEIIKGNCKVFWKIEDLKEKDNV